MKRKNIVAANWKMNLSLEDAEKLIKDILLNNIDLTDNQEVIFAIPFPYIHTATSLIKETKNISIAAQNCASEISGAYTGETSVAMLKSVGVSSVIIGHSERREIFNETNEIVMKKIQLCLKYKLKAIFCCGEPLEERMANKQNDFVSKQLEESILKLSEEELQQIVIAYEPIWAIGTGQTATKEQAQDMHAHIRSVLEKKFNPTSANAIPILYGGSVKAANSKELFAQADIDGGLVGGASLKAQEFSGIIDSLN